MPGVVEFLFLEKGTLPHIQDLQEFRKSEQN